MNFIYKYRNYKASHSALINLNVGPTFEKNRSKKPNKDLKLVSAFKYCVRFVCDIQLL